MRWNSLLLAMVALLATACGKDKSVEDYQREKAQQNLAQYQAVEGAYSGIVTSKEDGRVIGAMRLTLTATLKPDPGNAGGPALGTPVLLGNVSFLDTNTISLSAPDGYFDPQTGVYSANILIERTGNGENGGGAFPRPGLDSETITFSGTINGNVLQGSVFSQNFPEFGGDYRLERSSSPPSLAELLRNARPGDGRNGDEPILAYAGTTNFPKGDYIDTNVNRRVYIEVTRPNTGTAEDFLDLVSPLKQVQLTLNYSDSFKLLAANAVYDVRQGYVVGTVPVTVDGDFLRMTTECYEEENGKVRCTHSATGAGITATTTGERLRGPAPNIPDAPRKALLRSYVGRGCYEGKDCRNRTLQITYPARQLSDEITDLFFPNLEKRVQASIIFSEHASVSFSDVKWDLANGLLDGVTKIGNNGNYVANMQCSGFFFTKTTKPFSCLYWSSRSPVIEIEFKPPYR